MSKVQLYVYDLSKGMAKAYAPMFGLDIDGVWHSAVVVHGKEIYFGQGVSIFDAGLTHLGQPDKIIDIGETEIPWDVIEEYVTTNLETEWNASKYHLLDHNCNHFSEELCQFLTNKSIPKEILETASKVAATPFGQALSRQLGPSGGSDWVP